MITQLTKEYKEEYLELVNEFYHSEAVLHPVPFQYMEATYQEAVNNSPYVGCYLYLVDQIPVGYMLLSYSFSAEAGGKVVWLEELYIKKQYRGQGIGHQFLKYLNDEVVKDKARVRLEVEPDNERALKLYKSQGFEILPYLQMIKDYQDE